MSWPEVTDDAFLGSKLQILQPKGGYRAGLDAVLLAATVENSPNAGGRILDVGAGTGVVGLCVAARLANVRVILVEKQPLLVEMATENLIRNGLRERADVVCADVLAGGAYHASCDTAGFDHVVSNPPFYDVGAVRPSANPLKAQSHAMAAGGLQRWVRFMARMTKPGGAATMVHKADRLADVIDAFNGRYGDLLIQPLHPRAGSEASRIIVRGIKGSRKPVSILPSVVLHGDDNGFCPNIDQVLRNPVHWPLERRTTG